MELNEAQYQQIEHCLPRQRGNVSHTNLLVLNAILYKRRNEIERLFRRLKGFRRIFSRFEKLDVIFIGFILFALIVDGLR